jgi:hypothetical protein
VSPSKTNRDALFPESKKPANDILEKTIDEILEEEIESWVLTVRHIEGDAETVAFGDPQDLRLLALDAVSKLARLVPRAPDKN